MAHSVSNPAAHPPKRTLGAVIEGCQRSPQGFTGLARTLGSAVSSLHHGLIRPFQEIHAAFTRPPCSSGNFTQELPINIRMMILQEHAALVMSQHSPSKQDQLGYMPVFGTIVGAARILNAFFILTITIISRLIARKYGDSPPSWLIYLPTERSNYTYFLKSILRGLIELIPILGGGALFLYDKHRLQKIYESTVKAKAAELGIRGFS